MPHTVVLHHGLFGYDQIKLGNFSLSYFHKIDQAIVASGRHLIAARVHPTAGVETRAEQLKQSIERQLSDLGRGDDRLIIVAHSMGGLDARYMVARLGMADRVAAVVTVATPHRGSPYANWIVLHLGQRTGVLPTIQRLGLDVSAVSALTTGRCIKFNNEITDCPGVRYFSVGCAQQPNLLPAFAVHSHKMVFDAEGDNDGLVSLTSATWGKSLGTWPVSHWQAINKPFTLLGPREDVSERYVKLLDEVESQLL